MGKSKSSRRNKRHNPIQSNGSHSTTPSTSELLTNLNTQLTSPNTSDVLTALTSISVFASQKQHLTILVDPTVIKPIVPLLVNPETQNSAAGTLRNLSSVDEQFCHVLVKENVVEKIVEVLTGAVTWNGGGEEESLLTQCVALLWNLCETSQLAVKISTQNNLHIVLARYLEWDKFGLNLAITVAHTLYTLTEDNGGLPSSTLPSILTSLLTTSTTPPQLTTPCLGILLNIVQNIPSELPPSVYSSFSAILLPSLQLNVQEMIKRFSSEVPIDQGVTFAMDKKAEEINNWITCGKTGMEIVANSFNINSDEDEDDDEAMDCDDDEPDLLNGLDLIPLILEQIRPLPVNVVDILSSTQGRLIENYNQLRISGIMALQNIFESLKIEMDFNQVLIELMKLIDIPESSSVIRSLFSLWIRKDDKKSHPEIVQFKSVFFNLYQESPKSNIKINCIKILGSISILSRDLGVLKEVGLWFKGVLSGDQVNGGNLLLVVETVDTLMDMFSEDETDQVFKEIGILGRFKSLVGEIKKVFRGVNRGAGGGKSRGVVGEEEWGQEARAVVETVVDNLPRFLEYKGC